MSTYEENARVDGCEGMGTDVDVGPVSSGGGDRMGGGETVSEVSEGITGFLYDYKADG